MLMSAPFVQMAYVTNDFDRALAMFSERYGISQFLQMRDVEVDMWHGKTSRNHIALAYAGDSPVQIELIQPLSGQTRVYGEPLLGADGFRMVHHHQAHLAQSPETLAAMRASAIVRDHPIVIDGGTAEGVRYFYTDNRETIGHHIEYVYYPDAVWSWLTATIPRN